MQTRICKKCGETKPLNAFPLYNVERGWRRHVCVPCNAARCEKWRQENYAHWREQTRSYHNVVTKQRYRTLRREVIAAYGGRCSCPPCGESNTKFLTIDHIDRDGTEQRGRRHPASGIPFLLWIIKNNFPSDLRVLCFNCNLAREFHDGVCPHVEGSEAIPEGSRVQVSTSGTRSASHPYPAYAGVDDEMVRSLQ